MSWFWLSFAGEEGFRGVVTVKADSVADALKRAWALEMNPGGTVMAVEYPDEAPPEEFCQEKFWSPEEIQGRPDMVHIRRADED